jgi:hypothetical protein
MATDPTAGKGNPAFPGPGVIAMPQIGEKTATTWATYGADELNPNESCVADSQPGPATPSIPVPDLGGNESMLDMSGPK